MTPPPAQSHTATASLAPRPLALSSSWLERTLDAPRWARALAAVDAVVLAGAVAAAILGSPRAPGPAAVPLGLAFMAVAMVLLALRRGPDARLDAALVEIAVHAVGVMSLSTMLVLGAAATLGVEHPLGLALRLWVFSCVYVAAARAVMCQSRRQLLANPALGTPTLVVGAGHVGTRLVRRLRSDPSYGLRPVGMLDANPLDDAVERGAGVAVIGSHEQLSEAVRRTGARRVILAFSSEPDHLLVEAAAQCQRMGVEVLLVPRLFETINHRATLDHLGGMPLLALRPTDPLSWQFAVKHALDRAVAAVALVALAPLLALAALAVRISSPGPILFRQLRIGRDGKPFYLLKFRTMREPADAEQQRFEPPEGCAPGGIEGIDRRTRVGAILRDSSIDELPQLINVLRGEMSIVGPRPERPDYVERFNAQVEGYERRHRVRAGITGWAQVNGLRGQTSIADRAEWDNYYIQNWSLGLDLRILALTVAEVLRFRR
jgi:exopolysaccharide biosynthesis polyprenyl glycosylphosphotransferase